MEHIRKCIREILNEMLFENIGISVNKYDVVGTIKPSRNGFHGIGVVEKVNGNKIYISQVNSWINDLNYNMSYQRKNTIEVDVDNIIKINSDNIKNYSIDSQKNYEIYLHLLKKYALEKSKI